VKGVAIISNKFKDDQLIRNQQASGSNPLVGSSKKSRPNLQNLISPPGATEITARQPTEYQFRSLEPSFKS